MSTSKLNNNVLNFTTDGVTIGAKITGGVNTLTLSGDSSLVLLKGVDEPVDVSDAATKSYVDNNSITGPTGPTGPVLDYGNMYITSGSTGSVSVTTAGVTNLTVGQLRDITFTDDATADYLTIQQSGIHRVSLSLSVFSDTNNTTLTYKVRINGVANDDVSVDTDLVVSNAYYNLSGESFVNLAANDQISVYYTSNKSATLTFLHFNLSVQQL